MHINYTWHKVLRSICPSYPHIIYDLVDESNFALVPGQSQQRISDFARALLKE
eukprot:c48857_g1_i1 orf=212-370(-)